MNSIKQFLSECKAELEKVVWPDKNEKVGATIVVVTSLFILTLIVYAFDLFYSYVITKFLN